MRSRSKLTTLEMLANGDDGGGGDDDDDDDDNRVVVVGVGVVVVEAGAVVVVVVDVVVDEKPCPHFRSAKLTERQAFLLLGVSAGQKHTTPISSR